MVSLLGVRAYEEARVHYCNFMNYIYINQRPNCNGNKHNFELQRTDPGTKVIGEFNTKGCIFPPNAQYGFLSFPSF